MFNFLSLSRPSWTKALLFAGLWGAAWGGAVIMPGQGVQAQSKPSANQPTNQRQSPNTSQAKSTDRFPFPNSFTPPGDGRPQKTRGAGARDGLRCRQDGPVIRAIMPPSNYGLTLEQRPQVAIDFAGEVVPTVLLAFKDEAGTTLERVEIQVESTKSVQRFALPESSAALTVGKNYQWSLLVACDGHVNPSHPIFSGWVQRVSNTDYLADYLQHQSIAKRVDWLARYGYWYDAVAALTEGLEAQGSDQESVNPKLEQVWQSLLELVGAAPLAEQAKLAPSFLLS